MTQASGGVARAVNLENGTTLGGVCVGHLHRRIRRYEIINIHCTPNKYPKHPLILWLFLLVL
jgi:hypothetical protein